MPVNLLAPGPPEASLPGLQNAPLIPRLRNHFPQSHSKNLDFHFQWRLRLPVASLAGGRGRRTRRGPHLPSRNELWTQVQTRSLETRSHSPWELPGDQDCPPKEVGSSTCRGQDKSGGSSGRGMAWTLPVKREQADWSAAAQISRGFSSLCDSPRGQQENPSPSKQPTLARST